MALKVVMRARSSLKPYPNNPRNNEKAIDAVAASIEEFGWKQPIVVDKDLEIIAGHTRWKAAEKLGIDKVPVVIAEDLTPEQVKAYRLADNKTAELAGWDFELLEIELQDLKNMERFGFEIEQEAGEAVEDSFDESQAEERTKPGDVWKLGDHTLVCGDSTDPETVAKALEGQKADLLITDPPYNVDYTGKTKDALKIKNDKMGAEKFRAFLADAFKAARGGVTRRGLFLYMARRHGTL